MKTRKADAVICLCISFLTFLVYVHVPGSDFISIDDPVYVTNNSYVNQGFTSKGLRWAFEFGHDSGPYWMPLTMLSHMADSHFFGMNPSMHHLVNLIFHMINAVLVYLFFFRATSERWKSVFIALVFAVHPMNVESVAWITCRKNVLSTCFWLLTMTLYSGYLKKKTLLRYCFVFFTYLAGIMSKASVITLVFSLLLLDIWPFYRFVLWKEEEGIVRFSLLSRKNLKPVVEKIPFLAVAGLILFLNFRVDPFVSEATGLDDVTLGLRISNALVSYFVYVFKTVYPHNLTVYYPFPASLPEWKVALSGAVFIAVSLYAITSIKKHPFVFVGWFWFTGNLVMVSGVIQGGLWPAYADRFIYVPQIGLTLIAAWGIPKALPGFAFKRTVLTICAAILLCFYSMVAFIQAGYWKNGVTLYTHALKVNPKDVVSMVNLAFALDKSGESDEAVSRYRKILDLYPEYDEAHSNLGVILAEQGVNEEALYHFEEAVRINPGSVTALFNAGLLYELEEMPDRALERYVGVTEIQPDHLDAHMKAGDLLETKKEFAKALYHYNEAVRIDPDNRRAVHKRNAVKRTETLIQSTLVRLEDRLLRDPENPDLLSGMGSVYKTLEKYDLAQKYFMKALAVNPSDQKAISGLAEIHMDRSEYDMAAEVYKQALKSSPETSVSLSYNIACAYSMKGDTGLSVKWLKKAVDEGFRHWNIIIYDEQLKNIRNTEYFKYLKGLAGKNE